MFYTLSDGQPCLHSVYRGNCRQRDDLQLSHGSSSGLDKSNPLPTFLRVSGEPCFGCSCRPRSSFQLVSMAIGSDGWNDTRRIGNNTGFVQGDIPIVIGIHLISILLQDNKRHSMEENALRWTFITGSRWLTIDRLTRFIAADQGECRCKMEEKDCLCLGSVKCDCSLFLEKKKISHQSPFQCCSEGRRWRRRSRNELFSSSSSRFQDHQALTHVYKSCILSAHALVSTGCRGDYLAFAIVRSLFYETMCRESNCSERFQCRRQRRAKIDRERESNFQTCTSVVVDVTVRQTS